MKNSATLKSIGIGILKVVSFVILTILLQKFLMLSISLIPNTFWNQFDGGGLNEPLFLSISILTLSSAILSCFIFLKYFEKKPWSFIRFTSDNYVKFFFSGTAIAAILIILFTVINIVVGNINISLELSSLANVLIYFFVGIVILFAFVAYEELAFRGYILKTLENHFNKITAVLVSSLLFSAVHFLRPNVSFLGFIHLFLAGVFLAIICIYFNNLWIPTGFHFGWNFLLWFFNFPLSGKIYPNPILKLDYNDYNLVVGSKFGPEDSILLILLLVVAIGYFLFKYLGKANVELVTNK